MNTLLTTAKSWHDKFCHYADYLQHPFLLFVRLYWGIQLMQSGWGKLHNLDKVTDFFTSLNLPMPHQMALIISSLEFFGGFLLAVGLFSRLISFVLTINMIMAYVTADKEALSSIFSDPDKFTAAAPYVFLIASLIVFVFGAGFFSADELMSRIFWKTGTQAKTST
jgi:putative oxidoreductase